MTDLVERAAGGDQRGVLGHIGEICANVAFAGFALYGGARFNMDPPFNHILALVLTQIALVPVLANLIRDSREHYHAIVKKDSV